jgi:hypothetical protein
MAKKQSGDAGAERAEEERLIALNADACRADPAQPRHVFPGSAQLNGATPTGVLESAWEQCLGPGLCERMRAGELSPAEALAERRDEGVLDLALQITLEDLIELADSISRHGLRQPINVYTTGDGAYRIAEGERRWWAHLMLRERLGGEAPPLLARVQPLPDDKMEVLTRQHAEN